MEINRFTRLVFGLTQSPFILEATLKVHFLNYLSNYPKVIENISDDTYAEDLTFGGNTVGEVEILKQKCEELFKKGGFNLHKWHSNIPFLENTKTTTSSELTYANQMFQTSSNENKISGVPWNKLTDKLSISISNFQQTVTKRNTLSYMVSIYDPLGSISPYHVLGKVIYSELYDEKIPWDAEAPKHLKNKFVKWMRGTLSFKTEIPRSVAPNKESITAVDVHVFGDASIVATCAVVYAVVHQP